MKRIIGALAFLVVVIVGMVIISTSTCFPTPKDYLSEEGTYIYVYEPVEVCGETRYCFVGAGIYEEDNWIFLHLTSVRKEGVWEFISASSISGVDIRLGEPHDTLSSEYDGWLPLEDSVGIYVEWGKEEAYLEAYRCVKHWFPDIFCRIS